MYFQLCAQHTSTQITAPPSSGAAQAARKRHVKQYHALGWPLGAFMQVRPGKSHLESLRVGARGAGRRTAHTFSIRTQTVAEPGPCGEGLQWERGDHFWPSSCCSGLHALQRGSQGRCRCKLCLCLGSARARAGAGVCSKPRVHREVGKDALPSPVTACTSPQILPQTLLYLTPPSARPLASPCTCAAKAPCRCERTARTG